MATEMNFHGCQRRGILTVGLISKTCTGGMLPPSSGSIIRWGCLRTASVLSAKSECRSMSTSSGPQALAHVSFKRTKRKLEVHRRNHGQTAGYSLGQKNLNLGSSVTVCQTIRSRLGFFYKARFQIPMISTCGEPAKSSISGGVGFDLAIRKELPANPPHGSSELPERLGLAREASDSAQLFYEDRNTWLPCSLQACFAREFAPHAAA